MDKRIIIVIISILALALIAGGFWCVRSQKEGSQSQENSVENIQNQNQQELESIEEINRKYLEALESTPDVCAKYKNEIERIKSSNQGDSVWYEIAEMNIKFKVSEELKKDLVYSYNKSLKTLSGEDAESVSFSTKSLIAINQHCSLEHGGPLGSIMQVKGQAKDYQEGNLDFTKFFGFQQFDNFFIYYASPHAPRTLETENPYNFCMIEKPTIERFNKYMIGKVSLIKS